MKDRVWLIYLVDVTRTRLRTKNLNKIVVTHNYRSIKPSELKYTHTHKKKCLSREFFPWENKTKQNKGTIKPEIWSFHRGLAVYEQDFKTAV